jgi:VanZ family protein
MTGRALYWVPALGWMALIFVLSAQSEFPEPPISFLGIDKLAHLGVFAVLGLLIALAWLPFEVLSWKRVWLVTFLVAAYGLSDELHQLYVPEREFSAWDILADAAGGLLAAFALRSAHIYRAHDPAATRGWLHRCFTIAAD